MNITQNFKLKFKGDFNDGKIKFKSLTLGIEKKIVFIQMAIFFIFMFFKSFFIKPEDNAYWIDFTES